MPQLYQTHLFRIIESDPNNAMIDGADYGPLPLYDAPDDLQIGDEIEAFIYPNVNDDIVATMKKSYAQIGECANLEVISVNDSGAFLNWGLPKDLFLPQSEQAYYVDEGDFCVVYVYADKKGRPIASSMLYHHLNEFQGDLRKGDAVDLLIADKNELGFKAVINNKQLGLIYHVELSQPLELGTKMKGWVKKIREDGKIDLNVNALDSSTRDKLEEHILNLLKQEGGRIKLSDKSSPEEIYDLLEVSKKNFKRAIGSLYKQRLIKISPDFIETVESDA